jgi:hypothetical protein
MRKFIISFLLLLFVVMPARAARKPPWNEDGRYQRAYVIDIGLSALRRAPAPDAACLHRLHLGRMLYIISAARGAQGIKYYYVAVTRRTRGYIDAAALAMPAHRGDDERLMRIIRENTEVDKIILAQLLLKQFPASGYCADALLAEGLAAEQVAENLTSRLDRHPPRRYDISLPARVYWLNYPALDRYNRLGLHFRVDEENGFIYDGAAFKKIIARYPHSPVAIVAREHLEKLMPQ